MSTSSLPILNFIIQLGFVLRWLITYLLPLPFVAANHVFKLLIFFFPGYVHGKNIDNENQLLEDISPTTKSVRDSKTLLTEMSKSLKRADIISV